MTRDLGTRPLHVPRIVVGVDGSPDSVAALRIGAAIAALRGGSIVALAAWGGALVTPHAASIIEDLRGAAIALLERTVTTAFAGHPSVAVAQVALPGSAAAALIDESDGADLLVVGSRGHGGFSGLLLGSVSMACLLHGACPVLVVHPGDPVLSERIGGAHRRVVVGIGGADEDGSVLRAADRLAADLDADLLAVSAWEDGIAYPDVTSDLGDGPRAAAGAALEAGIRSAFGAGSPARLRAEVRQGRPSTVLIEESHRSDLLVVARNGRGLFASALLGSVCVMVAEHAACPVLVVPVDWADPRSGHRARRSSTDDLRESGPRAAARRPEHRG